LANPPLKGEKITMFLSGRWYTFLSHFWYIIAFPLTFRKIRGRCSIKAVEIRGHYDKKVALYREKHSD
jgi:hypothetical protein